MDLPMTMNFPELAQQAAADGHIPADEVLALRRVAWPDGVINADEAKAILAINDLVADKSREWTEFFVEAIGEYVVNGTAPKGYLSPETADWLMANLDRDGRLDSMAELELMVRVLERALGAPESFKMYALGQIERAVLSGEGPTRDGGTLDAGSITAAECTLLRRMIFASGGAKDVNHPAAVSRAEAELLFRIKDAALGADNAAEWQRLFVQGVGNYLQGWDSARGMTRERAAELEGFMNDTSGGLAAFLGRMTRISRNDLTTAAHELLSGGKAPLRGSTGEAGAAAAVTTSEQQWLDARIAADHQTDPLEQALIAFLAEAT
jgi:hypothetical protein